jgi:hypothetical protein
MTSHEYILLDASQVDICLVGGNITRPYIYVAVDESGKVVGMNTYEDLTSQNSIDFLESVRKVLQFRGD